jgi:LEA14-like dessication related protein
MMKKLCITALLLIISGCQFGESFNGNIQSQFTEKIEESTTHHKKVILILIDSMMGHLVDSSTERGHMPALSFLIERGSYYKEVVAPFPTMSVTIESSIVTGEMPDKHKIPGLAWYDPNEDRIVNYGTSIGTWIRSGVAKGVQDALYNLNNKHLSKDVKTIFEELDSLNRTSGAINTIVYRGNHTHKISLPKMTDELSNLPESFVTHGPDILAFGQFSRPEILKNTKLSDGYLENLGIQDQNSMEVVQQLIKQGDQPDFLMVYLPDFDKVVHKHNPHYDKGFEQVEVYLEGILNSYNSWEEALEENIFIVMGDHGQDWILKDKEELAIQLDELYSDYQVAPLNKPVKNGDIAFGVNQRMTYIYDVHSQDLLPLLAERAKLDQRIALAAWSSGEWVNVVSPDSPNPFRFKRGGGWTDLYNQQWSIEGDPTVLGLVTQQDTRKISYTENPDVLNQLYSSLRSSRDVPTVVLSAKPGYSFQSEGTPLHPNGGEHGGIHKNDSLAAMVISGTDAKPKYLRMKDMKEFIIRLLSTSPEPTPLSLQVQQAKKEVKKEDPIIKFGVNNKTKEIVSSMNGITDVVCVTVDSDIYIAVQTERWHRFRLRTIRSDIKELLSHRFDDYKVHVSTDWKIFRELQRLTNDLDQLELKNVKKKLDKIEKGMSG